MKTAISLPNPVFQKAEKFAKAHGMSRSELYASAVNEFIERRGTRELQERLEAYFSQGGFAPFPAGKALGRELVRKGLWEW